MFVLADAARLRELFEGAGFVDVVVEPVALERHDDDVEHYLAETTDLSQPFAEVRARLTDEQWAQVASRVAELAEPFTSEDGSLRFPACSLGAAASS
jgi:hypothetical protein